MTHNQGLPVVDYCILDVTKINHASTCWKVGCRPYLEVNTYNTLTSFFTPLFIQNIVHFLRYIQYEQHSGK